MSSCNLKKLNSVGFLACRMKFDMNASRGFCPLLNFISSLSGVDLTSAILGVPSGFCPTTAPTCPLVLSRAISTSCWSGVWSIKNYDLVVVWLAFPPLVDFLFTVL